MALHTLAWTLREQGWPAYLWYWDTPHTRRDFPQWLRQRWRWHADSRRGRLPAHRRSPKRVPHAAWWHLNDAVVIYPEVTDGNPLAARRVVRWFLNKPGAITGRIQYGPGERYFYFRDVFNDPALNPHRDGRMALFTVLDHIYRQRNFGPREGTCYILRKGANRVPEPGRLDGEVVDGLGHREMAALFNRREYCVSYDTNTMLTSYAALCGCKTVVVP